MIKLDRFLEIIKEEVKHFKPEDDLRVRINKAGIFEIIAKNRMPKDNAPGKVQGYEYSRIVFIEDHKE